MHVVQTVLPDSIAQRFKRMHAKPLVGITRDHLAGYPAVVSGHAPEQPAPVHPGAIANYFTGSDTGVFDGSDGALGEGKRGVLRGSGGEGCVSLVGCG